MAFAREDKSERDAVWRLRVLASVLCAAVLALVALVALAFHYANVANERQTVALHNQTAALVGISKTIINTRPVVAIKLALAAWPRRHADPIPKLDAALATLSAAVVQSRERKIFRGHEGGVWSAAF